MCQSGLSKLVTPICSKSVFFFHLGQPLSVRYTVSNNGVGVTAANRWYDRIFWSENEQLGM